MLLPGNTAGLLAFDDSRYCTRMGLSSHPAVATGARPARGSSARRSGLRRGLTLAGAALLVGTLVCAVHWPVLRARALSMDDAQFVTNNAFVRTPGWPSVGRFFGEVLSPSTVKGYYLPLSMTSLMLDDAMGGRPDDPRVFHRTSLALHALNTVLILLILYRLFGALVPAALTALLFGLHPLTVEPTAWIGERKTLLATCFALASILCYLQHARGQGRGWIGASAGLFVMALLSKPTVTPLPLLLLVLDLWPLRRLGRAAVVEKWPFYLVALASGAITLISHQRTAGIGAADYAGLPLRAGYLLAFYLRKMVWPGDLSSVYPQPAPFAISNPAVLLGVAVAGLLTLLLVWLGRRHLGPLTGWLFFVVAIAPTLGLVQFSWIIASDKYVYLPALGILMVVASGLTAAWGSPRLAGPGARAVILLALSLVMAAEARGVRTTLHNWADTLTLYRHMERVAPDSHVVHMGLGLALERSSAHDEALVHLRRATALCPEWADAHYNLGVVLAGQGHLEESIGQFRLADKLAPNDPPTVYNFAMALRLMGRLDDATAQFRRAVRLNPADVVALNELGGALVLQGRAGEAVETFQRALALAPANAGLQFRTALAMVALGGRDHEVASHLREAIRLRPDWTPPMNALAWLLATSPDPAVRRGEEALRLATNAMEITKGRDPNLLDTMAAAQAATGAFDEAARTERRAIEMVAGSPADSLAPPWRERLRRYERHVAYTEPIASAGGRPR